MRDALSMFDKAVSFCGARLEYKSVAQTLNVLDYDTYFNVTDMLLGGDYLSALRLFDEVLAKGFSGQTFMAGLAQHMRDLLVARDAASVSLIELTGTLLERYRAQAGRCTIEFLFGAISLLTEADGRIRQSSNQRLLVELGLMKIAGLGQKKNDGVALGTSYPLPPLTGQNAPAANPRHTTSGPSAAPTSATTAATATGTPSTATPAPAAGNAGAAPAAAAIAPEAAPVPQGTAAFAPAAEPPATAPMPARAPAPQASRPAAATSAASLIGGASLKTDAFTAIVTQARRGAAPETAPEAAEQPQPAVTIDPASGQKLESGRTAILDYIRQERPRLYAFFEQLRIEGLTLRLAVPTEALREEILRSKLEMLTRIAAIAGVEGALELEVTINEQIRAVRPIKLEDRLRHMNEKNPLLAELRRELDLEVE